MIAKPAETKNPFEKFAGLSPALGWPTHQTEGADSTCNLTYGEILGRRVEHHSRVAWQGTWARFLDVAN